MARPRACIERARASIPRHGFRGAHPNDAGFPPPRLGVSFPAPAHQTQKRLHPLQLDPQPLLGLWCAPGRLRA